MDRLPPSVVVVLATVVVLVCAATPAGGEPASMRARQGISGTFVFACSGCPQNRSGASLFIVAADGTAFRELPVPAPYHPRWSPRGATVAFSSRFAEIWTVDAASDTSRRVTRAVVTSEWDDMPAWSPDGKLLVFSQRGALFTMTPRGGRVRLLVAGPKRGSFTSPDWSPDGRRIAFDQNGARLFVVDADGKRLRRLALRGEARYPRWSPDGKWLAFIALGSKPALMVARADGSQPRIVVSRGDLNWNVNPAWSPDSRRLAFVITKTFDEQNDYAGNQIVTVRLDGSGSRPVAIPELPLETYSEFYGIDWTRTRVAAG
jgi:Tol biopolymer transport system component